MVPSVPIAGVETISAPVLNVQAVVPSDLNAQRKPLAVPKYKTLFDPSVIRVVTMPRIVRFHFRLPTAPDPVPTPELRIFP